MNETSTLSAGHLERLSEEEITHMLRGFPTPAVAGAIALRSGAEPADFESCVYGILAFYLPAGTNEPSAAPPGATRLRDDLGLDSLSLAEAMFKIEELFDITMESAEISEIETLADARWLLMKKLEVVSPVLPNE